MAGKTVTIKGKRYKLRQMSGYELTKVASGLDDADAMLKIIVATVEGLDEETAKNLGPGPYIRLIAEVREFLGIREADIKKLSKK